MRGRRRIENLYNKKVLERYEDYFYNERRGYEYLDPSETEAETRKIIQHCNYYRDYTSIMDATEKLYGVEISVEIRKSRNACGENDHFRFEATFEYDGQKYSINNYYSCDINEVILDAACLMADKVREKEMGDLFI